MKKEVNGKTSDLKAFITTRESYCGECGEELGKAWITLDKDRGALCLSCADLDHLIFLLQHLQDVLENAMNDKVC